MDNLAHGRVSLHLSGFVAADIMGSTTIEFNVLPCLNDRNASLKVKKKKLYKE